MSRQVIVCEITPAAPGYNNFKTAFWIPVPPGSEIPKGNTFQSQIDSTLAKGNAVTPGELTLLQNGNVIEEINIVTLPSGFTKAQVEAYLSAAYAARVNYYNTSVPNPVQFYGQFLDSTTGWSV